MKRMKVIATGLLLFALVGSIIAWPYRQSFEGGLIFAAFEAALVGALADWFAVSALFRHPLGMKFIPHTAIIPNNRDRIIEGIVDIVQNEWLSVDVIRTRIVDYPIIDALISGLETEEGVRSLRRLAGSLIVNTIKNVEPEDAARFVHLVLSENTGAIKLSPELVERFEDSVKSLYGNDVIQFFLDWSIALAQRPDFERLVRTTMQKAVDEYSNRGGFFRRLTRGLGESLDIVNYDEAAESITHRLIQFLIRMRDPANPYRQRVRDELDRVRLANADSASVMMEGLMEKVVNTEDGLKATIEVLTTLKNQMLSGDIEESPMVNYLTGLAVDQFQLVQRDPERKAAVESWIKNEVVGFVERYHSVIGRIVRDNLQSLNDDGFVESLEDKVGDDLQWIRVNGTVIGSLVGIAQYLILHLPSVL